MWAVPPVALNSAISAKGFSKGLLYLQLAAEEVVTDMLNALWLPTPNRGSTITTSAEAKAALRMAKAAKAKAATATFHLFFIEPKFANGVFKTLHALQAQASHSVKELLQKVIIIEVHFSPFLMQKRDPDSPKLTEHDKQVLRQIIDHSKIPDSKIAVDMGISPQAVFKIRTKLEELGIIKGYTPIIDFKKIGIHVLALLVIRLKPEVWNKYSDSAVSERISKIPYVISAYRVADARASHILLIGFRDTSQKEQYLAQIQTKHANDIEIKEIYTFSVDKIITQNPIGLLNEIIDKTDFSKYELFPIDKRN